jgi:broad specificity phosphatase PhoE
MKKLLFLFTFVLLSACNSNETTTYYLIRHAEKDRSDSKNKNPSLNSKGLLRANKWMDYFDTIDIDAVYATNYKRTQQTANPTAINKKLTLQAYDPNSLYDSTFQKATFGKSILVVGHSNTTPAFVNLILKEKTYQSMKDTDNSSLYVVTISGANKRCKILNVQ